MRRNRMERDFALGGKILMIDLSNNSVTSEKTSNYKDMCLGGSGINLWKLNEKQRMESNAFDPDTMLAFGTGILSGTIAPGASRLTIQSQNIYTGGLASANAGGYFAPELKYAGVDNLIITGKASKPVYILIDDGSVFIEDAKFIWGKTTWETEAVLHNKIGDRQLQILSIGPAGENLAQPACIIVNRGRAAGRCGLGAVMGSKNLKAIIVRGNKPIEVAHPEEFMDACYRLSMKIRKSKAVKSLHTYGTSVSFVRWNADSAMPTKNFQQTQMDMNLADEISHHVYKDKYIKKSFGCFSCPIHCSQFMYVKDGPYSGLQGEKIESQSIWDFGAKLGISDPDSILKLSLLCSELGLDIDNTSGAISWAIECSERGILSQEDTDGLTLKWGDTQTIIKLIRKIAMQDGIGALLAKGSYQASKIIGKGSEQYSMHIKGQELAEELRRFKGWALGVAVSPRGGGHTMGAPLTERLDIDPDLSEQLFGLRNSSVPDTYAEKAQLVVYYERFHALLDALGVCFFMSNWMSPDLLGPKDFLELYNLASGADLSMTEFVDIAERVVNLQKLYNIRQGIFGRGGDRPPSRLFNELSTGTETALDRSKWDKMLDEYYVLHGWDKETGIPLDETIDRMKLNALYKNQV
ncbi:MAG: aldehyde ferredoxin oxidoreductase family protein [bacterium]